MYENPKRIECLDDCRVGPDKCEWPWPCLKPKKCRHFHKNGRIMICPLDKSCGDEPCELITMKGSNYV